MNTKSQRIREIVFHDPDATAFSADCQTAGNGSGKVAHSTPTGAVLPAVTAAHPIDSSVCLSGVEPLLAQLEAAGNWPLRPAVDELFTKRTAYAPVTNGEAVVGEHHAQIYRRVFGSLEAKLNGYLRAMEANFASLHSRAARLEEILNATSPKIEVSGEGVPWNAWDRCKVAMIILLSALFITVDMNSVATTLQETGIGSFQSPFRAWFFSMVPLGVALCIKLLRDWLNPKIDRRIHAFVVTGFGILFGLLWLIFFAMTFPNITQDATQLLNSLSLDSTTPTRGHSGNWLIFCGLAAAVLAAAASWIAVESIIEAHRIPRRLDNPDYQATHDELNQLRPVLECQEVLISRTRGFVERIEKERQDFLAEARNLYFAAGAAVAYARDALARLQNAS